MFKFDGFFLIEILFFSKKERIQKSKQIQQTQNDIDTIKKEIIYILERLDYADGTYDSIRYVKDGKIDKSRN